MIGDVGSLALAVSVSPVPVLAVLLVLLGRHARAASLAFAAGWVLGLASATGLFILLGRSAQGVSAVTYWIQLVLGVLLVGEGLRQWLTRGRPRPTPRWLSAVDELVPAAGFGLGLAVSALNPKILVLCAAAGIAIGTTTAAVRDDVLALVVFTLVGSWTVLVPVAAYQIAADRLRGTLDRLKSWLDVHNRVVVAVLLITIGIVLTVRAIPGLTR
ncbi:GAP family protein [Gordonia neofelifaecis]|uniref:GAP family protein n=1 Tax=Gordonia neofelifaecis NRRL B-59395 TaxID=644548 RepID=F1YNP0_9ACTN|nr:GAP family protein [Gordonia neofelifaecis]EGD53650.1 hypothetical protein SCNU_17697 [Gordonia neofelifaecis NRRL B-59395]